MATVLFGMAVLLAVFVPLAGLALILGVDQVLERVRCVLNVTGDLVAAVVMDRALPSETSKAEEVREEARLEALRAETGEDVIADPPTAAAG